MELGAFSSSATDLSGELGGSLWDTVALLDSNPNLPNISSAIRAAVGRGAFKPGPELLSTGGAQLNQTLDQPKAVSRGTSTKILENRLLSQPVLLGSIAAETDSLTGTTEGASLVNAEVTNAKINFQPDDAPVPDGYTKDTGEAYSTVRGYGWVRQDSLNLISAMHQPLDITANTRDRDRSGIDPRLNTLVHMQYPGDIPNPTAVKIPAAWEYALPNGTYNVTVSVGDQPNSSEVYDSQHQINIEGTNAINLFQGSSTQEHKRTTVQADVSDGRLTIDAIGGFNTKLNYIEINSTIGTSLFKWETVAPSPIERSEGPPSAVVNDKLYVFGGFYNNQYQATKRSDVYNPATNKWTRIADMPIAVTHLNAAVDGQTIWFAGGFQGNHPGPAIDDVWKYSVVSDTWSKGPSLPEVRGGGALVRLGQELHYFGGYKADRETTVGDHWVLSLEGGTTWTTAAPLPNPRGHLGGEALGGKIYAIGGAYGHHKDPVDLDAVHAYDPATNTWKAVANLPIPRSHFESSTTIFNNRLLVIGGRSKPTGQTAVDDVTEYDPATNTWTALRSLPVDLIAPVAKVIDEQLIVTGGGLNRTIFPQSTTRIAVLDNS